MSEKCVCEGERERDRDRKIFQCLFSQHTIYLELNKNFQSALFKLYPLFMIKFIENDRSDSWSFLQLRS